MRLSKESVKLVIPKKTYSYLKVFSKSRIESACLVQRSRIVMLAAKGMSNKDISSGTGNTSQFREKVEIPVYACSSNAVNHGGRE